MFVVTTLVDGVTYEMSSYWYDGEGWVAITGNVDASKVIMRDNITMAGDYTQVGNKTKTQNGTAEFATKGMSVAAILTDIFSKRLQPTITAQPSVSGFNLSGSQGRGGRHLLASAAYTAGTLNPGSYQYGPVTGVVATNWAVQRITDQGTEQIASVDAASLEAGSDNNGGAGFIIGDEGGEGVVASLRYKVTATHGAGVTADDNLGDDSNPCRCDCLRHEREDHQRLHSVQKLLLRSNQRKAYRGQRLHPRPDQEQQGVRRRQPDHQCLLEPSVSALPARLPRPA